MTTVAASCRGCDECAIILDNRQSVLISDVTSGLFYSQTAHLTSHILRQTPLVVRSLSIMPSHHLPLTR